MGDFIATEALQVQIILYDNSSHNFYSGVKDKYGNKIYYGGIEKTPGTSAEKVCNEYTGYENFYFQKI